jgi:hypothetical protein
VNGDQRANEIIGKIRVVIESTQTLVERLDDEYPRTTIVGDRIEVVVAFDFVGDESIPVKTRRTGSGPALIVIKEMYRVNGLIEYQYNLEDVSFGEYFEGFHKHPETNGTVPHHQISGRNYNHREDRRQEITLEKSLPWLIDSYYKNRLGPAIRVCGYCRQAEARERP